MAKSVIPIIEQIIVGDNVTLSFVCEYKSVAEKVREEFEAKYAAYFKNKETLPFYLFVEHLTIPALLAVFPEEKTILLASTNLFREINLARQLQVNPMDDRHKAFEDLEIFCEKFLSVDLQKAPTYIELLHCHYPKLEFELDDRDEEVTRLVSDLKLRMNRYRPSLFEKVSDYGLGLTAKYALIRIHVLKFLAILPSLDHDIEGIEVKKIFEETLRRLLINSDKAENNQMKRVDHDIASLERRILPLPFSLNLPLTIISIVASYIPAKILAKCIRFSVRLMAKRFIAGESIEKAHQCLGQLARSGRDATLDQLGELVVSAKEADKYLQDVILLIKGYSKHVSKGEENSAGILRAHVSIKVSALSHEFNPESFDTTYNDVAPRLKEILLLAKEYKVFINIDAEHYHYRDLVFNIYKKLLLETEEFQDFSYTGIVIQTYLKDAYDHYLEVLALAKERKICMPIRLVKGAYWDAETIEAKAHSHIAPQFLNKPETDINFRRHVEKCLEAGEHLQLCLASHNLVDHVYAEVYRKKFYPQSPRIEHQCLHMTYEALSVAMGEMGYCVRNYVPIGGLLVGMAYLVRRIIENSSQVGILTLMRSHKKDTEIPSPIDALLRKKEEMRLDVEPIYGELDGEFRNISPIRTYLPKQLEYLKTEFSKYKITDFESPLKADLKTTQAALERSHRAFIENDWRSAPYGERTAVLLKAAQLMLIDRIRLASLIVLEAGKTIIEALGDVDEAIDFLNFYATEEYRLFKGHDKFSARGPTVAITPWNFPLAIPCGMAVAPLVAGNPVILKSAEQTPKIAHALVKLLHKAGVPEDILIHLDGPGPVVGAALVDAPEVATIVFTGSKVVGTLIHKKAAMRQFINPISNQIYPVKVITEMGGKNPIIVTSSSELDETVAGSLYSAFAHAGQKCSAASRILVQRSVKDSFLERFLNACQDIKVGRASDFDTFVNPLISKDEKRRLIRDIEDGALEVKKFHGKVLIDRSKEYLPDNCVGPVVIELPKKRFLESDSISRRELFGPVVHITEFETLEEAIQICNQSDYALTAGIFSQSQDDIDYFIDNIDAGNIYVNRSCTGARVGIEPFGGYKYSGTGPKAGGKNYVSSFHLPIELEGLEQLPIELIETKGGEKLELAERSKLSVNERKQRILRALIPIIQNMAPIKKSLEIEEKDILQQFKSWIQYNMDSYLNDEHLNRVIPGQLSYDSFQFVKRSGVAVMSSADPSIKVVMAVISAIVTGTGISLLCRTHEAFEFWSAIAGHFHLNGIPNNNINVFLVNHDELSKFLSREKIEFLLLDGIGQATSEVIQESCYPDSKGEMLATLTPYDLPHTLRFRRYIKLYIKIRSVAVNTMRHGAPLDIQL